MSWHVVHSKSGEEFHFFNGKLTVRVSPTGEVLCFSGNEIVAQLEMALNGLLDARDKPQQRVYEQIGAAVSVVARALNDIRRMEASQ